MKLPLLSKAKAKTGDVELPPQFEEPIREDIIQKAVYVFQCNQMQQYGAEPMAGNKYSSFITKRRREYRGCYGFGMSRTPRKILSRRGRRMMWVGATAPNTVGGRRAHPPKSEKVHGKEMPIKERRKAIRSAIAGTVLPELVKTRGHFPPKGYPFIVEDAICKLDKTKDVKKLLETLEFNEELARTQEKKVRAGKGKMRGRRYKTKRGLLIVVQEKCPLELAAKNIPGVEVSRVKELNVELLAPGAKPGRITLWTKGAIEKLKTEKLFL
jgi:large subunit ribosomal protein L4e